MFNSTTPRFEERCPGFFETTSTMNSRISAASFGRSASFSFFKSSGYSTESNNLLMFHYLFKPKNNLFQAIPFKSPLAKGDSGGCVFFRAIPRFHEDKLTTPSPPFLRGTLYAIHRITRINKMKSSIRFILNYHSEQNQSQNLWYGGYRFHPSLIFEFSFLHSPAGRYTACTI